MSGKFLNGDRRWTVGELVKELQLFDPNAMVSIDHNGVGRVSHICQPDFGPQMQRPGMVIIATMQARHVKLGIEGWLQ